MTGEIWNFNLKLLVGLANVYYLFLENVHLDEIDDLSES